MASQTAKAVAQDVIEAVKNKKRIVLGKIVAKRGYAKSTQRHPKRVTETQSYQEEIRPVITQLEVLRQKAITELSCRSLKDEGYKDLVDSVDKLTKNIQLLSGGATENVETSIKLAKDMTQEEINEFLKAKLNGSTERAK